MSNHAPRRGTKRGEKIIHNISLDPVYSAAMHRLAEEEDRGFISWLVTRMVDERMRAKVGRDWYEVIAQELGLPGDHDSDE